MIDYEVKGRVALITLNRPEARNAINRQVAQEMEAAIDSMEADDEVWVGVLRAVTVGDKPTFCSGQDLKAIGTPEGNSVTAKGGFAGLAKRERKKPLIVAVDGLATAGGCEIVLVVRPRRGQHAVVVRTGRGQAQPDRRRRRPVPPPPRHRAGGGHGGHPHR